MIVKEQKKLEFINDCHCIVDYAELEKAINWYSDKPTARLKHIYMHGNYPAVSIYKEKIHIHRLLMMYWLQCKLPSNYFVHHLDENKLNSSKANLVVVYSPTHQSRHNENKIVSNETRKLIALSNAKRKGIKYKKYRDDVNIQKILKLKKNGMSINAIAKKLNCDWTTVKARLKEYDNPELLEEEHEN